MTLYKIFNPQGVFPVSESRADSLEQDTVK